MIHRSSEPAVVRISSRGRITVQNTLREVLDLELPNEIFGYAEDGRIVIEPIPSLEELHGIHAVDHDPGEIIEQVRESRARDLRREHSETSMGGSSQDDPDP